MIGVESLSYVADKKSPEEDGLHIPDFEFDDTNDTRWYRNSNSKVTLCSPV